VRLDRDAFLKTLSAYVKEHIYQQKLATMNRWLGHPVSAATAAAKLGNTVEAFNSVPVSIYAVSAFSKAKLWASASTLIVSPSANLPASNSVANGFSSRC